MSASIKIDGMDELLAKIKTLQELKPVIAAIRAAAVYVRGAVITAVPQTKVVTRASVYGSSFKSIKQRKFFFAALRDGRIEVPYRRGMSKKSEAFTKKASGEESKGSKGSWTISERNNGLTQVVGSNASYGPYLMDPQKQTAYAKAMGWQTTQAIADETTSEVTRILRQEIDRYLKS